MKASQGPRDLELVRRALAGDDLARRTLTERLACIERIIAFRNRRVGNTIPRQELPDVVQEALTETWRRLPSFEGRARLETWLFRITCNVHLAALRKLERHRRSATLEADPEAPPRGPEPEQLGQLHRSLANLEPDDERLLRWRHYEAMSFVEIARQLGLSESGAKHRYSLALQRLRLAMEKT